MPWLSIARRDGQDGPEWRQSDWPVTDNLNGGRACPRCHATVHKGARWRAHWAKEKRDEERLAAMDRQLRIISGVVRDLAVATGNGHWYGVGETVHDDFTEDQEEAPIDGYVLGSGPLPEEMRGGEDG